MKFIDAQLLREKHRNLQGHIIKNGSIFISKLLILPIEQKEYDKAIMHVFNHNLMMQNNFEEMMSGMDVEVCALYYVKNTKKFNSPQIMPLVQFIEEVIPPNDLYSNFI